MNKAETNNLSNQRYSFNVRKTSLAIDAINKRINELLNINKEANNRDSIQDDWKYTQLKDDEESHKWQGDIYMESSYNGQYPWKEKSVKKESEKLSNPKIDLSKQEENKNNHINEDLNGGERDKSQNNNFINDIRDSLVRIDTLKKSSSLDNIFNNKLENKNFILNSDQVLFKNKNISKENNNNNDNSSSKKVVINNDNLNNINTKKEISFNFTQNIPVHSIENISQINDQLYTDGTILQLKTHNFSQLKEKNSDRSKKRDKNNKIKTPQKKKSLNLIYSDIANFINNGSILEGVRTNKSFYLIRNKRMEQLINNSQDVNITELGFDNSCEKFIKNYEMSLSLTKIKTRPPWGLGINKRSASVKVNFTNILNKNWSVIHDKDETTNISINEPIEKSGKLITIRNQNKINSVFKPVKTVKKENSDNDINHQAPNVKKNSGSTKYSHITSKVMDMLNCKIIEGEISGTIPENNKTNNRKLRKNSNSVLNKYEQNQTQHSSLTGRISKRDGINFKNKD